MTTIRIITSAIILTLITSCGFNTDKKKLSIESPNDSFYLDSVIKNNFNSIRESRIIRPGEGIGNLYIGQTRKREFLNEKYDINKYRNEGLEFHFEKGDTLKEIILQNTGNYLTKDGQKIGRTKKEIIDNIGQPLSNGLNITKGHNYTMGKINSLNYNGLTFISIDSLYSLIIIAEKRKNVP